MATTKHNHGPNFGRKVDGCPRCVELDNGATPVTWNGANNRRAAEREQVIAIRNHNCASSGCGPICTFGDW